MLKQLGRRLNPQTAIATIALFAAVGGGYATAFSGSGTVQKGALRNIPSSFTNVRTLTGIGSIRAVCVTGDAAVVFQNTSGEQLNAWSTVSSNNDSPNTKASHNIVPSGAAEGFGALEATEVEQITLHISPTDGSKAPQADVQITGNNTGTCSSSFVTVLATNTQE